jgi:acetyl esterase/lipase
VFHGDKDTTVPIARARDMVAALKKAGGQPQLTEYPSADHSGTAIKAHQEKNLLAWMFAQRRGKPAVTLAEIKPAKKDEVKDNKANGKDKSSGSR